MDNGQVRRLEKAYQFILRRVEDGCLLGVAAPLGSEVVTSMNQNFGTGFGKASFLFFDVELISAV